MLEPFGPLDQGSGLLAGFVYTALCFVTLSYVYFCVGEVTERTMEEIDGFFRQGIPAKKWKNQPYKGSAVAL
jgi:MFS transporter, SP family, sugar:H+ symporter